MLIAGPISEDFAHRIASLCFLGPAMDDGDGPGLPPNAGTLTDGTLARSVLTARRDAMPV